MKKKNHRIRINVADPNDESSNVIESVTESIPKKLFDKWFNSKRKVLIIAPADSVREVEIHEDVNKGG